MAGDRTLSITATPTLIWHGPDNIGANLSYQQTGSVPNMPNAVNRQTGFIDLSKMPANSNYTNNVDIMITLDASGLRDPSGNTVPAAWANVGDPVTNPMNGVPPNTPWAWFCATPPPGFPYVTTPVLIPNMASIRNSDSVVFIDDNTPLTSAYYIFCLGLVLWPAGRRYFITIDPIVGGKGAGNPPTSPEPR
jgi:hypothetical protein